MSSYFAPDYFTGTVPGVGLIAPDQPISDAIVLTWARDLLKDSGLFNWVGLGRNPTPLQGDSFPGAWVYPVAFNETDEVDPIELTRIVTFNVYISVKSDDMTDELGPLVEMDALSNAVANMLTSDGPTGYLPEMSKLLGGRYDVIPMGATAPAIGTAYSGVTLSIQIAYLVEGRLGRDQA